MIYEYLGDIDPVFYEYLGDHHAYIHPYFGPLIHRLSTE